MRKIKAQKLTPEAFQNYGTYQNLYDLGDRVEEWENGAKGFFPDLVKMNFGCGNPVTASVCKVLQSDGNVIEFTEIHKYTGEGILPLDGDCIIHVGKGFKGVNSAKIKAFYIPKGTFVSLDPGIMHGKQIAYNQELVHVLILLPGRTYGNDCEVFSFADEDKVEVEY